MIHRVLRVAGIAYLVYLALVVLVVLPALNILPSRFVKQEYGRELSADIILFNPFTLNLEARGVGLPELDGSPFTGLARASVDLSVESLWQQGWVFDAVRVEQFFFHLWQKKDGSLNFADLLPPGSESPGKEDSSSDLLGVTIRDFSFHASELKITDDNRDTPFRTYYENLRLAVRDLSTVIEEGRPYSIEASGEGAGSLRWEGTVSIPLQQSEGALRLSNIDLHTAWRFIEPFVQFELKTGRFNLAGDYELSWGDELDYQIQEAELQITGVRIDPRDPAQIPDTTLALDRFVISGIGVEGLKQQVLLDDIELQGLAVQGWSEGSEVSLVQLFAPAGSEEAPADTAENEPDSPSWSVAINTLSLTGSRVEWRSEFTEPPQLKISPIEARVENLNWPLSGETTLSLELAVNEQAAADITGAMALAEGTGAIKYRMQGLPLSWFNPNLPAELKASITDGLLQVDGRMTLDEFAPTAIVGEGAVTQFAGRIEGEDSSSTSFETIRWQGLSVNISERDVVLERLSIDNYAGRLHIREDGSINTQNVWQEQVGDRAEEIAEELELNQPWTVSLPVIRVTDSQIDFMDESLPIHFRTVVGDINGEALDLSTDPAVVTRVDIAGSVDGYAPVVLKGSAQPMSKPPALDLVLTFDGVDMALLTPYSGTYAGRAIERGLLNLDLKYSLRDAHLEGENKIVIEQLKLGERVDSEDAMDLPLDLGLALLTDANGVIDIALPVSGDVNDPDFDIGGILVGALVNLITKAVTAPFNLLASMVGSEEDLQRINFPSGSAQLSEATRGKLDQLQEALAQRPGLTLIIMGRLSPDADMASLREQLLDEQFLADGLSAQQLESKGPEWEKAVQRRYKALGTGGGENPTLGQQYRALRDQVAVPQSVTSQLLEDRAVATKTYLVNEAGMAADRAVIQQVSIDDPAHKFSGVELDLDS